MFVLTKGAHDGKGYKHKTLLMTSLFFQGGSPDCVNGAIGPLVASSLQYCQMATLQTGSIFQFLYSHFSSKMAKIFQYFNI